MKISINCRVLTERKGGPYQYTLNIIRELSKLDTINKYFIVLNDDYQFDFNLPANFEIVVNKTNSKVLFDYFYIPYFSHKYKPDIFLFPKNTFSPLVSGKKIPVFHDIIYFEKELDLREFNYFDNLHHYIMIPISAKFSACNLTVSDFTASRMIKLLKINPETIKIIKEGVEDTFREIKDVTIINDFKKKYNISLPCFFYSGSLSPRKNMIRVLQAFNKIKNDIPHVIYYTGGYSWRDSDVYKYIEEHNLENRVIKLGYLSKEELIIMYNIADCYLYPSLYEGFGLPILEAQACGCPVITSNVASCPEVAGDGAICVDPYDVEQIASAMVNIYNDVSMKKQIIEKGFANVKKYSWEKCAKELLALFNELNTINR